MTTPSSTPALVTPEELDDMEALASAFATCDRWERLCREVRRQDTLILAHRESQERCAEASLAEALATAGLEVENKRLLAEIARIQCRLYSLIGPAEHKLNGCCS